MANKTHGKTGTRIYGIWAGMKARCNLESDGGYRYYGGRGIKVCKSWNDSFIEFDTWSSLNGYNDLLTIDRINNQGDYEPSNCRWITQHEQVIRQDRFSHRNAIDKNIVFRENSYTVIITKGRGANRKSESHTFDNLEMARIERNFIQFCFDNNLEYKYPFYIYNTNNNKHIKKGERKISLYTKIEKLIQDGLHDRQIAKKLKISIHRLYNIKKELDNTKVITV